MKRIYSIICFIIWFALSPVCVLCADKTGILEQRTVQPSVTPNASAVKVQPGGQALAVQVCDRLVKLNERARSINHSIGRLPKTRW
jgi:hypothetical protein